MGQRILRAKGKIANAGIPYRVPTAEDLPERLDGVLAVVYLVFTTGYSDDGRRPRGRGDPARAAARRTDAGVRRGTRAARADAAPACPPGRARRRRENSSRSRTRTARVGTSTRSARRSSLIDAPASGARVVPHPGRARFRPRHGARRRLDGLAAHRRAVRRAAGDPPVADRGAQPSRRRRDERRTARRAARHRCGRGRASTAPPRAGGPG